MKINGGKKKKKIIMFLNGAKHKCVSEPLTEGDKIKHTNTYT